jgi:hypothetical protein
LRPKSTNNTDKPSDLVSEQAALPDYFQSLLGDELLQNAGTDPGSGTSFECLTFTVHALHLAIPCSDSSGVITDPSFLQEVVRQWRGSVVPERSWWLGSFHYQDSEIMVADISALLIPPDIRANLVEATAAPVAVVLVNDGHMGIVCDQNPVTTTVRPEDVCWSEEGSTRPWLSGVVSKSHALLATPRLCSLLAASPAGRLVSKESPES